MRIDDIKAPPITPQSRARVTRLVQHMADAADILEAIFPPEEAAPAPAPRLRAVPVDWKLNRRAVT